MKYITLDGWQTIKDDICLKSAKKQGMGKIEEYQKSIEGIDDKIAKNQKELDKIAKEYEETISNIDDYTSNDIYKYFSERYE